MLHIAIIHDNFSREHEVVQKLLNKNASLLGVVFENQKIALLSRSAINDYLVKERQHELSPIKTKNERSLQTFSSGEQKKAFLNHILEYEKPDCLILDNLFDGIDIESQKEIASLLERISSKVNIIQLATRKGEVLAFVKELIVIQGNELVFQGSKFDFDINSNKKSTVKVTQEIPQNIKNYADEIFNPLIRFKDVSVCYDQKGILQKINWTIQQNEFWQLKGPNGSGKSTLLSMIIGDNPKAFGQDLHLFGKKKGSGESVWELKQKIGYYTASMIDLFSGSFSAQQMVVSGFMDSIGLYKKPADFELKISDEWLEIIGLKAFKNNHFRKLQLWQQRLVLIARAMIKHPLLLILDEPTTDLDDNNAARVVALVNKIAKESKTAIIFVSHSHEPGLEPDHVFELVPTEKGSIGFEK